MRKEGDTVRYTADELKAMRERNEGRIDQERIEKMTDADIEDQAADEPAFDWANAQVGIPPRKKQLTMRIDNDVLEWFQSQGRGYQTYINAVLRHYMETQKDS